MRLMLDAYHLLRLMRMEQGESVYMDLTSLIVESALRALLYHMEARMGREEARKTEEYQKMDKALADLEAKHVAEISRLLGLNRSG